MVLWAAGDEQKKKDGEKAPKHQMRLPTRTGMAGPDAVRPKQLFNMDYKHRMGNRNFIFVNN
jgi:hypothetical protein